MFKLLIMEDGLAVLDDDFYVYVKDEFLPIIEVLDKSIHRQFVDVLRELRDGWSLVKYPNFFLW